MTNVEIIIDYLKHKEFDGLCTEGCTCGFETGDLFHGRCESFLSCEPAYKKTTKDCNACNAKDICRIFEEMNVTHLYCTRKPA